MQSSKPKIQRVYITAKDPETKETASWTLYNATPAEVRDAMLKLAESKESQEEQSAETNAA